MTHRGPFQPLLFCDSVKLNPQFYLSLKLFQVYWGFFLGMVFGFHFKYNSDLSPKKEHLFRRFQGIFFFLFSDILHMTGFFFMYS